MASAPPRRPKFTVKEWLKKEEDINESIEGNLVNFSEFEKTQREWGRADEQVCAKELSTLKGNQEVEFQELEEKHEKILENTLAQLEKEYRDDLDLIHKKHKDETDECCRRQEGIRQTWRGFRESMEMTVRDEKEAVCEELNKSLVEHQLAKPAYTGLNRMESYEDIDGDLKVACTIWGDISLASLDEWRDENIVNLQEKFTQPIQELVNTWDQYVLSMLSPDSPMRITDYSVPPTNKAGRRWSLLYQGTLNVLPTEDGPAEDIPTVVNRCFISVSGTLSSDMGRRVRNKLGLAPIADCVDAISDEEKEHIDRQGKGLEDLVKKSVWEAIQEKARLST